MKRTAHAKTLQQVCAQNKGETESWGRESEGRRWEMIREEKRFEGS